jgi:hypothetical protein
VVSLPALEADEYAHFVPHPTARSSRWTLHRGDRGADLLELGADDGIRTREPHLGKVVMAQPVTCSNALKVYLTCAFACSMQLIASCRYPVVRGTDAGRMRDGMVPRTPTFVRTAFPGDEGEPRREPPCPQSA